MQPTVSRALAATLAPTDEVFEITIRTGTRQLGEFNGAISASVSYTHNVSPVLASRLAADGSRIPLPTVFDAASSIATFEIDRFSLFVVGGPVALVQPPVEYNDNENENDEFVPPMDLQPRPPITPVSWADGQTVTAAITGASIAGAVRNSDIGMLVSLRIVAENLLGSEPGWIGSGQPITLTGQNAAGQHMTVVFTQGSARADITIAGYTRNVSSAWLFASPPKLLTVKFTFLPDLL